jgi:hypothetical protein
MNMIVCVVRPVAKPEDAVIFFPAAIKVKDPTMNERAVTNVLRVLNRLPDSPFGCGIPPFSRLRGAGVAKLKPFCKRPAKCSAADMPETTIVIRHDLSAGEAVNSLRALADELTECAFGARKQRTALRFHLDLAAKTLVGPRLVKDMVRPAALLSVIEIRNSIKASVAAFDKGDDQMAAGLLRRAAATIDNCAQCE